jgi:hypothetical protein
MKWMGGIYTPDLPDTIGTLSDWILLLVIWQLFVT